MPHANNKYSILLLTHNTADNLGDIIIGICAESIIQTVLSNLRIKNYSIVHRDLNTINRRYLDLQSDYQEEITINCIKEADLIVFGGAPIFNYSVDGFAPRTAKTLEIIKKHTDAPIIFSSIGIEKADYNNQHCLRLKKAIQESNIIQITTRDNLDDLRWYTEGTDISIDLVSDPAVFSGEIFDIKRSVSVSDRLINIFVIRGASFKSNKIPFTEKDYVSTIKALIELLKKNGYDYRLMTTGTHVDEAFLAKMCIEQCIPTEKIIHNNSTRDLMQSISGCSGMIACRLHANILAYSVGTPCVGLVWNPKVKAFYASIGYDSRAITHDEFSPEIILKHLQNAISESTNHNDEYRDTVYRSLFSGIKRSLGLGDLNIAPYSHNKLIHKLNRYRVDDTYKSLEWRLSRMSFAYNKLVSQNKELNNKLNKLQNGQ